MARVLTETDSLLAESNRHLNQMYGLLESMDDGVMAWNEQGVLQFLNARAALLLHLDAQASQGKNIHDLLNLPMLLRPAGPGGEHGARRGGTVRRRARSRA